MNSFKDLSLYWFSSKEEEGFITKPWYIFFNNYIASSDNINSMKIEFVTDFILFMVGYKPEE